jgi:hypothetical protein
MHNLLRRQGRDASSDEAVERGRVPEVKETDSPLGIVEKKTKLDRSTKILFL